MKAEHLVLDFGMHLGEDTEFYLAAGADVVAFEANEALVEKNRERFAKEIDEGRLRIVYGAIVGPEHQGKTVSFFLNPKVSIFGTANPDWVDRNSSHGHDDVREVKVPAVPLASVLDEYPGALMVKIDIEGADQVVVESLSACRWTPDYISIESEKVSFDALVGEIETLKAMGYTRFAAVQQATVPGRLLRGDRLDTGESFAYRFQRHGSGPFGPFLPGGIWKDADGVIADYRKIFRRYALFGDQSMLMQNRLTRFPTNMLNGLTKRALSAPLCGWFDTHAKL